MSALLSQWLGQHRPPAAEAEARATLNRRRVRLVQLNEKFVIGIWSFEDCAEVRNALRVLRLDQLPITHLEDPLIPDRYRIQ